MARLPAVLIVRVNGARVALSVDLAAPASDAAAVLLAALDSAAPPDVLWLEHAGVPLHPLHTLADAGVTASSALAAHARARGGGGDGGSTGAENRAAYLEMYAEPKAAAVDPGVTALARCTRCALSGGALSEPIVCDELGSLFNKDAIVRGLLDKTLPKSLAHISSLKHVIDARLTRVQADTAAAAPAARAGGAADTAAGATFCCPITGTPINGRSRFLLLRPSGLVVADKAVAAARAAVEDEAGGPFDVATAIRLHPPPTELAAAREALLSARAAASAKRDAKKRKKGVVGEKGKEEGGGREEESKQPETDAAAVKKAKLAETLALAPAGADKAVYASIFTSSKADAKETFNCRGQYRAR